MAELSQRQRRMLEFIRQFHAEKGYPPTIREIQKTLTISSTSVVDYNLNLLEEAGHLRRSKNISRGVELVGISKASSTASVPIAGTIAAGQPIPVLEETTVLESLERLELPPSLIDGQLDDIYALRVKGRSMVDALIDDGDIVLLRYQQTAENGETVAAWLKSEKETTLKRFYHEGTRIRLQPCNVTMAPIYTSPDNVEIQGRVVAVIRRSI
jgi:repressor LexA